MTAAKPEIIAARREFYDRLRLQNAAPLWESLADLVTPEPRSKAVPAHWTYRDMRPLLMESGGLITAKEAERRVLVLENPALAGLSRVTGSLYAGLQLVLPGEVTSSHRHVASALRFTIEGEGAYTTVDGVRAAMHAGDFIVTPSWTFHEHGNTGSEPVVWLDGLDIPIVNLFDTSFAEHVRDDAPAPAAAPPAFRYPYDRARVEIDRLRAGEPDPRHGFKMAYVNPVTGGPPMPTIAAFLQFLPGGFAGRGYRSTDATVFCAVEGSGSTQIGAETFAWSEHDVFVAPSWSAVRHSAARDAVLFSFSDRAAQVALGLWREGALPD